MRAPSRTLRPTALSRLRERLARRRSTRGFTLIELMVVMVILAILLTVAVPRYFSNVEKSKEAVLRQDLKLMRESIDKYYGDLGKYPDTLQDLVTKRYLRSIPVDPMTDSSDSWVAVPPEDSTKGGVYDVKSGAQGTALDGKTYGDL